MQHEHGGNRTLSLPNEGVAKKRKRLSGDERLNRNRERNRIHARRTRERKKTQSVSLQNRINELNEEGIKLRQLIDERYTASSLLGLSQLGDSSRESLIPMLPSSSICRNYYADTLLENTWPKDDQASASTPKRVRRSGKYSQQERDRIRRERNRMHAKKTRDRKKQFLEMSENIIAEMEAEAKAMRSYLLSLNLISEEDCALSLRREMESKEEIAKLKKTTTGEDDQADFEDDEEDDDASSSSDSLQDDNQADREARSQSSSDDNEKVSSWSGSSDGNSNHNSSGTGSTSRNTNSSSSRSTAANDGTMKLTTLSLNGNGNSDKASDASNSANQDKRSDSGITNSSGDDPDRDSPEDAKSMGLDWSSGDDYRVRTYVSNSAPESYHHGKVPKLSAMPFVMPSSDGTPFDGTPLDGSTGIP